MITIRAAACLCGALLACDADPTIYGDGLGANGPIALHDNPNILGVQRIDGERWRYSDPAPLDGNRPASSRQTVWADATAGGSVGTLLELEADQDIFSNGLQKAVWTYPNLPGGSSEVYVPGLSKASVPWQYLPPECSALSDPACAQYWSRPAPNADKPFTFPFVLGNINLEPNTPVTIAALSRTPFLNGSTWSSTVSVRNTITVQLDPNTSLIPIHVHVFTDARGNLNHGFFGGMANSDAGRLAMAEKIRNVFDEYSVVIERKSTVSSNLDWHKEYTTRLTRNLVAAGDPPPVPTVYDELLLPCRVQTRLWAVDFIRQPDGLETAEIGFGNANQQTPSWPDLPGDIQRWSELMRRYIMAMNWNAGVHVFITGKVNTGQFTSFETAGIAFTQFGTRPGYALISALSSGSQSDEGARKILMHEVAHVLGLRDDGSFDEITELFANQLRADGANCGRIRQEIPRLLRPAVDG
ncbi:MAG TPA: hypothetical protein VFX59_15925 [Polyangiales bacterium]|nr:hypothetical protein [Polyangiales bacterium]